MKKKNLFLLIILVFSLMLISCDKIVVSYDIIFYDSDGTTLLDKQRIERGNSVVFKGTISNEETFMGWDLNEDGFADEIPNEIEEPLTCVAVYIIDNQLVCKFVNYDGTILKQVALDSGVTPVAPEAPTRNKTAEFSYIFIGWDKEIVPITSHTTYTAKYEETTNNYEVIWNLDGGYFASEEPDKIFPYGTTILSPNVKKDGYEFVEWNHALTITNDTEIKAVWRKIDTPESYDLEFSLNEEKTAYSVTGIGASKEENLIIPSTYKGLPINKIENNTFKGSSLKTIVIPNSITTIGNNVLTDCDKLTKVTMPSVITVGTLFLDNTPSLLSIKTNIGEEEALALVLGEAYRDYIIDPEKEIDKYILDYTPPKEVNNIEELAELFDYYSFINGSTFTVKINFSYDNFNQVINDALAQTKIRFSYRIKYTSVLTGDNLTINLSYENWAIKTSEEGAMYTQKDAANVSNYTSNRDENFNNFAIEKKHQTFEVTNSEQLYYVLEKGYRPTFTSPDCSASILYNKAKAILRSIIDDRMTKEQKLFAIYEWLIMNVTYDNALLIRMMNNADGVIEYNGLFLEGVFNDQLSVCDGISKAFTVLARIEGITCIRVTGDSIDGSLGHAWNKVKLDGIWYVIDATHGGRVVNNSIEILVHDLFLVKDEVLLSEYVQRDYQNIEATTTKNYYQNMNYTYLDVNHDYYINSQEELNDIIAYYLSLDRKDATIDFFIAFDYGTDLNDELENAFKDTSVSGYSNLVENNICVIMSYTTR